MGSSIGKLALYLGDLAGAASHAARAAEIAAQVGDTETLAWALYHQAIPLIAKSIEDSLRCFDRARELFHARGDVWAEALAIVCSGIPLAMRPGHETQAQVRLREGQRRMHDLGDDWGATVADPYLSITALRRGDQAAAQAHVAEVMRVARALNDGYRVAGLQHHLARVAIAAGAGKTHAACCTKPPV